MATGSNRWIAHLKPRSGARLRLFCFPYAGGGASVFRAWPESLPSEIEVCPVQPPGREARLFEPPFTRLTLLVEALAPALRPYLVGAYAFFGHSLGALVGFELARTLARQHEQGPLHLFVSGHGAPQVRDTNPPLHQLPDAEFVRALRGFNGTPDPVLENSELMELMLPTLKADFAVNESYVYTPQEPLECPISAFGGLQDGSLSRETVAAWREQTRGPFSVRMVPGDHFSLLREQTWLLSSIRQDLEPLLGQAE